MIIHEAVICHNAYLNGEDDSTVKMDKPANIPVPMNAINSKISHHGIPRLRIGESPRRACTMFSLLVQNAVPHKVIIAIMKPLSTMTVYGKWYDPEGLWAWHYCGPSS